jgi:hypothetical protein
VIIIRTGKKFNMHGIGVRGQSAGNSARQAIKA